MQRWLASQAKHPKLLIVVAVVMIATGPLGLATVHGAQRVTAAAAIPLGIYLLVVAIAGLREERSGSRS